MRMKKIILYILSFAQMLLFAAIIVLEKSSHKYMTFMRIVLYKNRTWEAAFPMDTFISSSKIFFFALAACSILYLMLKCFKTGKCPLDKYFKLYILAIIAFASAVFITVSNVDSVMTYYAAVMLLAAISMIQLIKLLLSKNQSC